MIKLIICLLIVTINATHEKSRRNHEFNEKPHVLYACKYLYNLKEARKRDHDLIKIFNFEFVKTAYKMWWKYLDNIDITKSALLRCNNDTYVRYVASNNY